MPHLRDMSQNFTGHFESQQKDIFCQSNLHQDKDFKWKNDQHEVTGDVLSFPKSSRSPSYDKNWESYGWYNLSKIWKVHEDFIENFEVLIKEAYLSKLGHA